MTSSALREIEEELTYWLPVAHKYQNSWRPSKHDLAQFALGVVYGMSQALEAMGYEYWEDNIAQLLRDRMEPDEIDRTLDAAERWLGRRSMRGFGRGS